jgi:hypothetical protein
MWFLSKTDIVVETVRWTVNQESLVQFHTADWHSVYIYIYIYNTSKNDLTTLKNLGIVRLSMCRWKVILVESNFLSVKFQSLQSTIVTVCKWIESKFVLHPVLES